eukprot:scaffold119714_cov37-Prasinocladus_malaysianus.AAC.1
MAETGTLIWLVTEISGDFLQVKDIMAHLYFKAKEAAARDQPPEVRIIKHLLSMEDPKERMEALEMAFEPSEVEAEGDLDLLHS